MNKIKILISKLLIWVYDYVAYKECCKQYNRYLLRQNYKNAFVEGEDKYVKLWSTLSRRVEPYSYRFFSHYCGRTPYIIPEDIGHTIIERILNPERFRPYYCDKNMYAQYIRKEYLPKTILCRINGGGIMDVDLHLINEEQLNSYLSSYNRIVLKPSIDSCSGIGVMLFVKAIDGRWICEKYGTELSYNFLKTYSNNFVLQEAIEQHPYMAQFCSTSVNTLRLTVYRSVKTEEILIPSAIMRIGRNGEFVDNGHAGGAFIGLDLETGKVLNKFALNQYGDKFETWNDINYSQQQFQIPNWPKVLELAKYIGKSNRHCRLLALDIAIDKDGMPRLIEYNCYAFSFWLFMYCGETVLGQYTKEVIDYCKGKMMKLSVYINQDN